MTNYDTITIREILTPREVYELFPAPTLAKQAPFLFGRKPTFKNIRTLSEQEVEALKEKK